MLFRLLSDQSKHMVIPFVNNCARFYVLPKIHKCTLAFLLIVSNVGTVSHKFARFLSQNVGHLTCNNFYTLKKKKNLRLCEQT